MSFDALTLSAVRDELEPLLSGARLQKVVLPDELSLALEAFAPGAGRTNLLLSAHPEQSRVQRLPNLPARGIERDTPFSLVVRKHLRDARIRTIRQPRLERVFELDCEQRDASGQHYRVVLIVEAMGRRSNLVLVDEQGIILDAARRSPPSRNSRRPVLPHLPYVPPPPQDRLFPEEVLEHSIASLGMKAASTRGGPRVLAETLAAEAAGRTGSLARFLSDRLAGLSPLSGRELAFRATGSIDTPLAAAEWPQVAEAAQRFLASVDTHDWQPTVAFEDDRPLEYAPYVLSHLEASGARLARYDGISAAMDAYYAGLAESGPARRGDLLAAERRALLAPIARAVDDRATQCRPRAPARQRPPPARAAATGRRVDPDPSGRAGGRRDGIVGRWRAGRARRHLERRRQRAGILRPLPQSARGRRTGAGAA